MLYVSLKYRNKPSASVGRWSRARHAVIHHYCSHELTRDPFLVKQLWAQRFCPWDYSSTQMSMQKGSTERRIRSSFNSDLIHGIWAGTILSAPLTTRIHLHIPACLCAQVTSEKNPCFPGDMASHVYCPLRMLQSCAHNFLLANWEEGTPALCKLLWKELEFGYVSPFISPWFQESMSLHSGRGKPWAGSSCFQPPCPDFPQKAPFAVDSLMLLYSAWPKTTLILQKIHISSKKSEASPRAH